MVQKGNKLGAKKRLKRPLDKEIIAALWLGWCEF
jgi:hypothetical protein